MPRLAADIEVRRQEALTRIEQADKALAEPFKHADPLKAAQANTARIDQLMADASKPVEPPQTESEPEPAPGENAATHGGIIPTKTGFNGPRAGATKAQSPI